MSLPLSLPSFFLSFSSPSLLLLLLPHPPSLSFFLFQLMITGFLLQAGQSGDSGDEIGEWATWFWLSYSLMKEKGFPQITSLMKAWLQTLDKCPEPTEHSFVRACVRSTGSVREWWERSLDLKAVRDFARPTGEEGILCGSRSSYRDLWPGGHF